MFTYIKRGALALGVAATVILGGGFASAGYGVGDDPATSTVDVSFTVISYRAIELSSATPVAFGAVRQGASTNYNGTAPTILYATTWGNDKIEVGLNSDIPDGIKLYLYAGQITEGAGLPCPSGGSRGAAAPTVTLSASPTVLITGIANCGAAASVAYPTATGGVPTYSPSLGADTWITATQTFILDTSGATNTATDYSAPVQKTITYTIKAG